MGELYITLTNKALQIYHFSLIENFRTCGHWMSEIWTRIHPFPCVPLYRVRNILHLNGFSFFMVELTYIFFMVKCSRTLTNHVCIDEPPFNISNMWKYGSMPQIHFSCTTFGWLNPCRPLELTYSFKNSLYQEETYVCLTYFGYIVNDHACLSCTDEGVHFWSWKVHRFLESQYQINGQFPFWGAIWKSSTGIGGSWSSLRQIFSPRYLQILL